MSYNRSKRSTPPSPDPARQDQYAAAMTLMLEGLGAVARDKRPIPDVPDFTLRDEANAITAFAVRNGFIEELHAGRRSDLLEDKELSRITDAEMKKLMIEVSGKIAQLLAWREVDPKAYFKFICKYYVDYCLDWER